LITLPVREHGISRWRLEEPRLAVRRRIGSFRTTRRRHFVQKTSGFPYLQSGVILDYSLVWGDPWNVGTA